MPIPQNFRLEPVARARVSSRSGHGAEKISFKYNMVLESFACQNLPIACQVPASGLPGACPLPANNLPFTCQNLPATCPRPAISCPPLVGLFGTASFWIIAKIEILKALSKRISTASTVINGDPELLSEQRSQ